MKKILIRINKETAEMEIKAEGYMGSKCIEATEFLTKALGELTARSLLPIYYQKDNEKEVTHVYKPICG